MGNRQRCKENLASLTRPCQVEMPIPLTPNQRLPGRVWSDVIPPGTAPVGAPLLNSVGPATCRAPRQKPIPEHDGPARDLSGAAHDLGSAAAVAIGKGRRLRRRHVL